MHVEEFPACTSRCLWLLSMNEPAPDFQWHQHSAQVCKEAQPPVGFATRASARLFLNIRHKPCIYSASLFLAPEGVIRFHRRQWWYSHLRQRGMAGTGKSCPPGSSTPRVMSDLFLVPCMCPASKVCYLVLTGQTVCEALFLFDRINIVFRSRRLV